MYSRKFVRNNYWFLVMNRKSPCQELDVSSKKIGPRKVVKSKKREETTLHEDSDDERECFINIRKKKLDLMRKNSPGEESSSSSLSLRRSSSSEDVHCMKSKSIPGNSSLSTSGSGSDGNLQDENKVTKKPRLRLRLRRWLKRSHIGLLSVLCKMNRTFNDDQYLEINILYIL